MSAHAKIAASGASECIEAGTTIAALRGKILVVKYGGSAQTSASLKEAVLDDIAALHKAGVLVVLVHGGGPEIGALLARLGKESRFVNGLRFTDSETMEAVTMTLCGTVNKSLVSMLVSRGVDALGISGFDAGLLTSRRLRPDGADIGLVGDTPEVRASVIKSLLDARFLPVVSPTALEEGSFAPLNVNADTSAAAIAASLKAERFLLLTDVPGLLRDVRDSGSLIPRLSLAEIPALKESGVLTGGMIPKIECCAYALQGGAALAQIVDGRAPHAVMASLAEAPCGTVISGRAA